MSTTKWLIIGECLVRWHYACCIAMVAVPHLPNLPTVAEAATSATYIAAASSCGDMSYEHYSVQAVTTPKTTKDYS